MDRLIVTVVGIVAAVGLSGLVFIGVNKLFDLTETRYPPFSAIVGGLVSGLTFAALFGNRFIALPIIWDADDRSMIHGLVVTLVAGAIGAAAGYMLALSEDPTRRLAAGVGGGALLGVFFALSAVSKSDIAAEPTLSPSMPSIDPVATVVWLLVGAAIGLALWTVGGRNRDKLLVRVLPWVTLGWLFGAWLSADLDGNRGQLLVVAVVLGALLGAIPGTSPFPTKLRRSEVAIASRKYIFLAPALFFVAATLVVPLGRTIWLGFLTGPPNDLEFTGLTNYSDMFTDPGIINFKNFGGMFTSWLFLGAVLLVVLSLVLGRERSTNAIRYRFQANAGSTTLMAGGLLLLGFAIFTHVRGTISNNLWWIFSVIVFAVSLGLAVAALADRAKGENIAKSLIFLPMAISFVGAGVIWRLIYVARPAQDSQTGVFNTLWVQIGEWSHSTTATLVITLILGSLIAGLLYLAWRGWQAESYSIVAATLVLSAVLGWVVFLFWGPGVGGFTTSEVTGEVIADPVLFIQESPWNNFWMMLVFIWIYTGFAMVIFSAAIKAVPEELLEAARIDGATESQTFWRVTVPQIFPTIGVVVTTLVVTVLKVFDIPKVMTNGNFDTQVLANEMWERAFTQLDFGLGSAVAVVLFIGVLPVMAINIRRMQKERLG